MSRLSLGDNTGVTSSFLTPATEPNAGIHRQVLALHCPVHQVLTGSEERSTESSLEHIPLSRERCYFFFLCKWMFLPIIYAGRVSRVTLKQNDWL